MSIVKNLEKCCEIINKASVSFETFLVEIVPRYDELAKELINGISEIIDPSTRRKVEGVNIYEKNFSLFALKNYSVMAFDNVVKNIDEIRNEPYFQGIVDDFENVKYPFVVYINANSKYYAVVAQDEYNYEDYRLYKKQKIFCQSIVRATINHHKCKNYLDSNSLELSGLNIYLKKMASINEMMSEAIIRLINELQYFRFENYNGPLFLTKKMNKMC